jgi:DEAD/DEAH box helicase domain-containing protein
MWQQAGRAGRRSGGSLAVLVAQDDPLDQFLVTHPADLFDKPPEAAVVDPTNPFVLEPHLACAAREHPLSDEEVDAYWPDAEGALERLEARGEIARRRDLWHHRGREMPHRSVDLRSAGGHTFSIVIAETGELLGTVDESRAYTQVHPGAVYLHQGEQFEVLELDLTGHAALVRRSDPDYYTQARDTTDILVESVDEEAVTSGGVPAFYGTVHVTNQVVAFARKMVATGEILDVTPLALPPQTLETKAVWWAIPSETIHRAAIKESAIPGAAHAAEHAAIGLLPLVATCDRWDVGGVSTAYHPDTGSCAIFVYDGYPGGAGITERGYRTAERWLDATLETVRSCPCPHGCPSCVQSPKCGNGNEPLDKAAAVALLAAMLKLK